MTPELPSWAGVTDWLGVGEEPVTGPDPDLPLPTDPSPLPPAPEVPIDPTMEEVYARLTVLENNIGRVVVQEDRLDLLLGSVEILQDQMARYNKHELLLATYINTETAKLKAQQVAIEALEKFRDDVKGAG